jgi:asparagine synthase (glutamine-hydrolysing)
MCGVSAIFSSRPDGLEAAITRMVEVQDHRGPDGRGVLVDLVGDGAHFALGQNRLSIIDLTEHGSQPMRSRDGRFVLVYNGEVYNYLEIAADLDRSDLPETFGDTAVVLAALVKWGPQALPRFNGMWALLLYDTVARTLLISRDRFGVKPLYVYRNGTEFVVASEIKAILAAVRTRPFVNPDVAIPYLTRGLLNVSNQTFLTGIEQFPPASYQLFNLRNGQAVRPSQKFWQHPIEYGAQPAPGAVTPEEVRAVFLDAVTLRLRSDVPIGVLLSGGVDSSSIVGGIASTGNLGNVSVLAVTSNDPSANEERFIDLMASYVKVVPHKVNVSSDPRALLDRVTQASWYNAEPLCGVSDIAHLRLMELARSRGIKVMLSGQGADEQLGGYNKFFYFWLQELLRGRNYFAAAKTVAQFAINSHTLYEFRISEAIRYLQRSRLAGPGVITEEHAHRDSLNIGLQESYAHREFIDLTQTSVPALLHYEDRMSMSRSVEIRVPFLDYRVVECLARVHPSEKFAGGRTKSIFRDAIKGLVPHGIRYRRDKKGFTVPEDRWMRNDFRTEIADVFNSNMMAEQLGLIDAARLRSLYSQFVDGGGVLNGRHFFRAYAFEIFLRRFRPSGTA